MQLPTGVKHHRGGVYLVDDHGWPALIVGRVHVPVGNMHGLRRVFSLPKLVLRVVSLDSASLGVVCADVDMGTNCAAWVKSEIAQRFAVNKLKL